MNSAEINIIFFSECYANKGFSAELKIKLCEKVNDLRPLCMHGRGMGRDEILRKIKTQHLRNMIKALRIHNLRAIIVVIDREEGISTAYIDKWLCKDGLESLREHGFDIDFCRRYEREWAIYGIIFNPRIEDSLLCKLNPRICEDYNILSEIKSKRGFEIVRELVSKHSKTQKLLTLLAGKIAELI